MQDEDLKNELKEFLNALCDKIFKVLQIKIMFIVQFKFSNLFYIKNNSSEHQQIKVKNR